MLFKTNKNFNTNIFFLIYQKANLKSILMHSMIFKVWKQVVY